MVSTDQCLASAGISAGSAGTLLSGAALCCATAAPAMRIIGKRRAGTALRRVVIILPPRSPHCTRRWAVCARLTDFPGTNSGKSARPELVAVEADLAAIAKYSGAAGCVREIGQAHFSDGAEITCRVRESAGAALEMHGISDDGEEAGTQRSGRSCRRIEEQGITRFRDPVMLNVEDESAARARLGSAEESSADRAAEISSGRPHCRSGVDRAEVGHDHTAYGFATAVQIATSSRGGGPGISACGCKSYEQ